MIIWGYIFHTPGANPATDRFVLERNGVKTTLVAVADHDTAADVARGLVEDGAKVIELCGAFGFAGAAKVKAAVGDRAAVNFVTLTADSAHQTAVGFGVA